MEYSTNSDSSPIPQNETKMNFQRFGCTLESIITERDRVISQLKAKEASNQTETRLKVLQLRKFNRHLANIITDHRKRLSDLKDLVDNLNSKLLCQKFEKKHLLDEIKACLSAKNIFESIELESSEEIESTNPDEQHHLMIKRLQRELSRRQELQVQLISILQRKQQTEAELQAKKQKIEDLRNHLQNLLKVSKPLIDACGYDLEAFYKKKMTVDDSDNTTHDDTLNVVDHPTRANLNLVYEQLVDFVADKSEYKLRYFEALERKVEADDDEEREEFEADNDRNQSIKAAYIQIKLELEGGTEPIDIFLKLHDSILLLSIQHELIPENTSANWLKSFAELDIIVTDELNSNWMALSKLQPDSLAFVQDFEAYYDTFSLIKDALHVWSQLQSLVQDQAGRLEFDRNALNELIYTENNCLRAKVTMNSIVWTSLDISQDDLISSLNMIGSKYRSVLDCLQAQLELLQKNQ